MKNNWRKYRVMYWNHDTRINDCFGNHMTWTGKARTEIEAVNKAKKANKELCFRFRSVQVIES